MTLENLTKSYFSLNNILKIRGMNGLDILKLVQLKHKLTPYFETFHNEEAKIIEDYADKDKDGNPVIEKGIVKVSEPERELKAKKELYKLRTMEISIEPPSKIMIPLSCMNREVPINGEDIENLDWCICFEGANQ